MSQLNSFILSLDVRRIAGGLAREMEDQLMQEFESLMARKQQKGNRAAGGDGSEPVGL